MAAPQEAVKRKKKSPEKYARSAARNAERKAFRERWPDVPLRYVRRWPLPTDDEARALSGG